MINENRTLARLRFKKAIGVCIGSKTEPYQTEKEALTMPEYNAEDLKGKELEIFKTLKNGIRRFKDIY